MNFALTYKHSAVIQTKIHSVHFYIAPLILLHNTPCTYLQTALCMQLHNAPCKFSNNTHCKPLYYLYILHGTHLHTPFYIHSQNTVFTFT